MVKPALTNLEIAVWLHPGKLGLSQPSICPFRKDQEGLPILHALQELLSESASAQRALTFAPCNRDHAFQTMRLILVPQRDDLHVMNIRHDNVAVTIEMTALGLCLLIDACQAWLEGAEDFSVSPRRSRLKPNALGQLDKESGELWFWGPGYSGP